MFEIAMYKTTFARIELGSRQCFATKLHSIQSIAIAIITMIQIQKNASFALHAMWLSRQHKKHSIALQFKSTYLANVFLQQKGQTLFCLPKYACSMLFVHLCLQICLYASTRLIAKFIYIFSQTRLLYPTSQQ